MRAERVPMKPQHEIVLYLNEEEARLLRDIAAWHRSISALFSSKPEQAVVRTFVYRVGGALTQVL